MNLVAVFVSFLGVLAGLRFWPLAVYAAAGFSGVALGSREPSHSLEGLRNTQRAVLVIGIVWLGVFSAIAYLLRDAGGYPVACASFFGGIASTPCFALVAYFIALHRVKAGSKASGTLSDRAGTRAASLEDGTGYLLAHSRLDRAATWIVLLAAIGVFGVGVYAPVNGAGFLVNAITLPFAAGLAWLFYWSFRFTRNQIQVSDRGIAQRRRAFYVFVPWSEVSSIREAPIPISVIFRSSRGDEVRVDKKLVGLPPLLEFAERHLTPQLYFSTLCYFRPEAALALRQKSLNTQ